MFIFLLMFACFMLRVAHAPTKTDIAFLLDDELAKRDADDISDVPKSHKFVLTGAGPQALCAFSTEQDKGMFSWRNLSFRKSITKYTRFNSYSASHDNWCTATLWNRIMTAQCEGMGEVGSARYEPALLPPCPSIRVLSYSNSEIQPFQHTGLAV